MCVLYIAWHLVPSECSVSKCSWSYNSSASRWHTLDMSPAKSWASWVCHSAWNVTPCKTPQNLSSKGQWEVAASQELTTGSCPNSTFPLVQLPTPCTGPGLSPVQNEDFVWHLVLGTLLSLFLGTGPAGQVCKSMTHAHTHTHRAPTASAIYSPATLAQPQLA
jgi:hypothetical protein